MPARIDLTGLRFGRLYAISDDGRGSHRPVLCRCDCGTVKTVRASNLRTEKTRSCGCLRIEVVTQFNTDTKTTHGYSDTVEFKLLNTILIRCYEPKSPSYETYGGRGIGVCEEWRNDRGAFVEWARANGHKPGLQIDRIDNNKGYSPDNCRFVSAKVNNNNKNNNRTYVIDGQRFTTKQLAEKHGIKYTTLHSRLSYGWDLERALHEPV